VGVRVGGFIWEVGIKVFCLCGGVGGLTTAGTHRGRM